MREPLDQLGTHEVFNQPGPVPEQNLFECDPCLRKAVDREGARWATSKLAELGEIMGRPSTLQLANDANRHSPELESFDRFGRRIDEVVYHPAYHCLMDLAISREIHSIAWTADSGGHVAHTALEYLFAQVEGGVCCPVTMTYAAVPTLKQAPDLAREWLPRLFANCYDSRFIPAGEKRGATLGMAMTEKQGGSDLRTNSTVAQHLEGDWYGLRGHKWFCSAPMSDAFLSLARIGDDLSCFLVPRWRPDGHRNPFFVRRLKNKLGNRSNASAEIEYDDTWGHLVGPPGRGIATIMDMVKHTRLDTCLAPVALMRQSLVQALHHVRHRQAFGKTLVDQPLMRTVLADLSLELEGAVNLLFRVARSFDEAAAQADGEPFSRLAAGIAKFHLNKVAPGFVCEAMEVLGGSGYVEESLLPRLYREAPLNGIWEGSGNVICLDVLRTALRYPESLDRFFAEVSVATGENRHLDRSISALKQRWQEGRKTPQALEPEARRLTEAMASTWQGALMCRFGDSAVADAFCASRLGEGRHRTYGTSARSADVAKILNSVNPGE